jgi:subtilisin family serine protease
VNGDGPAPHICDPQRPGDLILGVRREYGSPDDLIERGAGSGLPGLEALRQRSRLGETPSSEDVERRFEDSRAEARYALPDGNYDFRLLEVPEGEEQVASGSLIRLFMTVSQQQAGLGDPSPIIAQPNHILGFDAGLPPTNLSPCHERYLKQMGITRPSEPTRYPRVRIIDSGYNGTGNVVLKRNLLDPGNSNDVQDDDGHGSLVTTIIDDIANSPLEIFKVGDAARKPTEWEVLEALSIPPMTPIVNLSMSLGFGNPHCSQCGRRPVGARTAVFQERLRELQEAGVIVVVAAGNQGEDQLAYPSRFATAVAVEACSGHPPRLASYSNSGAKDERGEPHQNVFLCPGGNPSPPAIEGPALESDGSVAWGTSYAAAYMSGLLASTWAAKSTCNGPCTICREDVLTSARFAAKKKGLRNYDQRWHGNGLAHV